MDNKVTLNNRTVDFDACVILMDDEIREELHNKYAPECSNQEFLDLYCKAHQDKFGEEFEV